MGRHRMNEGSGQGSAETQWSLGECRAGSHALHEAARALAAWWRGAQVTWWRNRCKWNLPPGLAGGCREHHLRPLVPLGVASRSLCPAECLN
jgi:hypothetical protein